MTIWTIPLPYQRPPITDNARLHWAAKARIVAQLRADAHKLPKGLGYVWITLCYFPPDRRRRDHSGLYPTLKPLVDGIVTDYGLCPDDDTRHVWAVCRIADLPTKPARLELRIEDRSNG